MMVFLLPHEIGEVFSKVVVFKLAMSDLLFEALKARQT